MRTATTQEIKIDQSLASEIQRELIKSGVLTGKADGRWGPVSQEGLLDFQAAYAPSETAIDGIGPKTIAAFESKPTRLWELGDDYASAIVERMAALGLHVFCGQNIYNIVYIEGVGADLRVNSDAPDKFNDVRLVIQCHEGKPPAILGRWEATSEPGLHYTKNRMNPKGAARIAIDAQHKAWCRGRHGFDAHDALVQVGPIKVHRDSNEDGLRTGDPVDIGCFAINQHHGYDNPADYVGRASAGCLVGRTSQGHAEFMSLVTRDLRYKADSRYWFWTTVLNGSKI